MHETLEYIGFELSNKSIVLFVVLIQCPTNSSELSPDYLKWIFIEIFHLTRAFYPFEFQNDEQIRELIFNEVYDTLVQHQPH